MHVITAVACFRCRRRFLNVLKKTLSEKFAKSMKLRDAKPSDVEAIRALHTDSIRAIETRHYSQSQLLAWARSAGRRRMTFDSSAHRRNVLLAEQQRICGFAELSVDTQTLTALYVAPAHWHEGVGSLLLLSIEERAQQASVDCLSVPSSLNAVGFYARYGYHCMRDSQLAFPCGTTLPYKVMLKQLRTPSSNT